MQLPCAYGMPPASGRIRTVPEDFVVEEQLGFDPDLSGAHVLLWVEKRGANTGWVAAQIARQLSVQAREVGWSGHKDRAALTRQWFSVPLPLTRDVTECLAIAGEGFRVLDAHRHGRKLRPGSHRSNRFAIRVRELEGDTESLESRLVTIAARGVPNYFGPQRFGRGGANLERALAWADGRAPRDRAERSFVLSAARSWLFNAVLSARVADATWDRLLPGEAVILDGRRSFFHADEIDATLESRLAAMDVHPSGPLPGRGGSPATGEALAVEQAALPVSPLVALLESQGLAHERRSLRLPVRGFAWRRDEEGLLLEFELPKGAFATAVLHEIVGGDWDASESAED